MSLVKSAKAQLRKEIKNRLKSVSHESITAQSNEICALLTAHNQFVMAKSVAIYMNMPHSEVQTDAILRKCYELGKHVYLPRCNVEPKQGRKSNYLSMLQVPSYSDVTRLEPQGKYKLLEPTHGVDAMDHGDLDLIIMPGVAFTTSKLRLGHGAGFYDEFLSVYYAKHHKKPYLIGVGLKEQLATEIPHENHDWNLDNVIIGNNIY